jgi:hypothetical protein
MKILKMEKKFELDEFTKMVFKKLIEFLKPDKLKLFVFVIFFIASFIFYAFFRGYDFSFTIVSCLLTPIWFLRIISSAYRYWTGDISFLFESPIFILIDISYWYLISCIVVFISYKIITHEFIQKYIRKLPKTSFFIKIELIIFILLLAALFFQVPRQLCEFMGGRYDRPYFDSMYPVCELPLATADKPCTDTSQCMGLCITDSVNSTEGRCTRYAHGWDVRYYLVNGTVKEILIE